MHSRFRLLLGSCLVIGLTASVATAAAGRMKGIIGDSAGKPLEGVVITVRGADYDYEKSTTTNKNGKFNLTVTDATRPYIIRVEKEGYQTIEQPFEFDIGALKEVAWVLISSEEAAQQVDQLQALQATDKATKSYNAGAEAYNAGDLDGAIGHFRAAVEANAKFELAQAALARVFLEAERWQEARGAAEAFLALKPDDPIGLQMLYDSYWEAGETAQANEILQKLIKLDSGSGVAARIFNQAVAATKKQDYKAAERGFTQALELDPELYQAQLPLAQISFSRGEWQAAIDKAEAYLEHDAGNPRANIVRYLGYQELGNSEAAASAFAEIEQNSPDAAAELFLRDGTNLYNNGEIAAATKALETSLALDANKPQALYQLGLCYASAGRNADAKKKLQEFLERAPDHPEAASVRDMLTYLD